MRELVKLESIDRREWLKARALGIGSSDAAVVMGLSSWKSPFSLWAEKTGLVQPENLEEKEYIEWGIILEPIIADKYQRTTGRKISSPTAIYQHDKYDWMLANPDRFVEIEGIGTGVLEVKTAGQFLAKDWEEEAPLAYQIQLQHQLCVTGAQWGSFAVLIGGQKFRWMDVKRNDSFLKMLLEKEEEFWHYVQTDTPPPIDDSDSTADVLKRLYPKDDGSQVVLPVDAYVWADELETAKEMKKIAEQSIQLNQSLIEASIGSATYGMFLPVSAEQLAAWPERTVAAVMAQDGKIGFTWKKQGLAGYVVEPCEYRVLRVEKAGKAKKGRK